MLQFLCKDLGGVVNALVGVLECCADSHDCGCVGVVVGGLLEYFASGLVCCIWW